MSGDYLYRNHYQFNRDAIVFATGETYLMEPPYAQIYQTYLFASTIAQTMKVPVGLVHGKETYTSVADLEVRPWIEVRNDQGVTPLSDHLFRYQVGDLVYHIFVDLQDNRKALSIHFRGWQGNVLVVHEVNGEIIQACDDDMELVKEAVKSTLGQHRKLFKLDS